MRNARTLSAVSPRADKKIIGVIADARIGAELSAVCEAVEVGHHDVEQDEIGPEPARLDQRGAPSAASRTA